MLQRLLQNNDIRWDTLGHLGAFRDHQNGLVRTNGDLPVSAGLVINGEGFCIVHGPGAGKCQAVPADCLGCSRGLRGCFRTLLGCGGAAAEQQSRQNQCKKSSHFSSSSVEESRRMVYSISWGVLMATVSATTAIFTSSAVTGISKEEPPSLLTGSYFTPSTII